MSELLLTGEVAGFSVGESYEAMIEKLGAPPRLGRGLDCDGFLYGDLEIYFEGVGGERGKSQLVYLNHWAKSGSVKLQSKAFRFDPEGLAWGIRPQDFCGWMIGRQIPFSYRKDPDSEKLGRILIDLEGKGREVCFNTGQDGEQKLVEIYFSRTRSA